MSSLFYHWKIGQSLTFPVVTATIEKKISRLLTRSNFSELLSKKQPAAIILKQQQTVG